MPAVRKAEVYSQSLSDNPNLNYPQVRLANLKVQQRINSHILRRYRQVLTQLGFGDPEYSLWSDYEVNLNARGILSLTLEVYSYRRQAAHGLTIKKSLTFNLNSGQLYRLKDLFSPGSNYVTRISRIIRRMFVDRNIPMVRPFVRIKPDEDFYMTSTNLVIYFQLYEYTPYVYGFPEFFVPYCLLTDIIAPRGPAARFL